MKFYKIMTEKEKHYDMQYTEGMNIDVVPFNPSGACRSGGIYFAREDIFEFYDYGPWIREVIIPEDGQVYENPGSPKKWKADRVILGAKRAKWDLEVIKELVESGANIHAQDDYAIRWASSNGQLEVVKYLAENGANIHAQDDYAICWASENGQLEVVKYLAENGANIHAQDDLAIRLASNNGQLEVVKYLKSLP